jgi:hypothetical protein
MAQSYTDATILVWTASIQLYQVLCSSARIQSAEKETAPPHWVYCTQYGQTLAYGQSFWLNYSVHRTSHMRYSLSHQIGQPNGKDVPRTFSRGSPDSGVQLTVSNGHNLGLTISDRKDIGVEDAQSTFSAKISCA